MTDWWKAIEEELDRLSDGAPNPWAGLLDDDEPGLTQEQMAFLAGLGDQPSVSRLDEADPDEPAR